ncbi:epithelial splicing regulatory protein 1-like isoform X1 [Tigriopus californicus]|uniref:epithelial splicing regulatory protein 1-like isoform X1 n=1 Tax=Tigriopus californicus TaxID=6832 RepID=UPI0027D9DAA2|nr:epithelial splicing regulatory protein 1-like isoform X1 [Tigriopus californicus]
MGSEEPKCDEEAPPAPTLPASSKHAHSSSNGLPETVPCSSSEMNLVTVPNSTEETCPNYHNNNNNNQSKYLVIFYTVSAGLNAAGLGNDEEDLVSIYYHIIDVEQNKVVDQYFYPVRPHNADLNENVLSEECRNDYQISEESIQTASNLSQVLEEFHKVAQESLGGSFTLVTDGQFHIRQALFPEAYRKEISLQEYYHHFHDLRKEFIAKYPDSSVTNVDDMLKYLGLESDSSPSLALKDVNNMVAIVQKLICDDVHFHEPERVLLKLEQGIRSRTDAVDGECCVRARGLPWQASDQDIARFFVGLNLARGGVALCLSSQGRRNGEALVLFESPAHRDMALKRHKHHIGNRYIEVYKASGEDFINVAGGNNKEAQSFLSRGGQVIIRMRGLPYDCTAKQVTEFFESGESGCDVLDKEDGVLFVRKPDGRATGDAFVLFTEEKDAEKALQKHKEIIGSRYIELFRSTTAEVTQILNRTVEQNSNPRHGHHNNNNNHAAVAAAAAAAAALAATNVSSHLPLIPSMSNPAVLPQQMVTAGTRKDCIRLRGLPYEAGVENILEFLGEHGKNIVNQGIHMVYNAQGQPSGEAFIEMTTEHAAFQAATHRHHRNMTFGKKQRYIEVFQCSGEDMNYVLTGNSLPGVTSSSQITPSKNPYISTTAGMLPPGMLSMSSVAAGGAGSASVVPVSVASMAGFEQLGQASPAQANSVASNSLLLNSPNLAGSLGQGTSQFAQYQPNHNSLRHLTIPTSTPGGIPSIPVSSAPSNFHLAYQSHLSQMAGQQGLAQGLLPHPNFGGLMFHPSLLRFPNMMPSQQGLLSTPVGSFGGYPSAGGLLQNPMLAAQQQQQQQQRLLLQQQQQAAAIMAAQRQPVPPQFNAAQYAAFLPQATGNVGHAMLGGKRGLEQAFAQGLGAAALGGPNAKRPSTYSPHATISANPTTYNPKGSN